MNKTLRRKLRTLPPKQIAELYRQVFESEAGQLVLEDLKNQCFFDRSTHFFDSNQKLDNDAGNINIGRRLVIIGIINAINLAEGNGEGDV